MERKNIGAEYWLGSEGDLLWRLIQRAGYKFRSISFHTDGRWIAKGARKNHKWRLFNGKTPHEAIEKLIKAKNSYEE